MKRREDDNVHALKELHPEDWNNIPIPLSEAI